MTENEAYAETIYFLEGRLALAIARETEARTVWQASNGAAGTLEKWTDQINKVLEVQNTIHGLRSIQARHFGTVGA